MQQQQQQQYLPSTMLVFIYDKFDSSVKRIATLHKVLCLATENENNDEKECTQKLWIQNSKQIRQEKNRPQSVCLWVDNFYNYYPYFKHRRSE